MTPVPDAFTTTLEDNAVGGGASGASGDGSDGMQRTMLVVVVVVVVVPVVMVVMECHHNPSIASLPQP